MRDAAKQVKLNPPKSEPRGERREPEAVSFSALGLSDELMEAVKELGLTEPTEVQAIGIPAVLAGENVAMASHTGSGKTLAYMLPIVQALRRDEAESGTFTRARRPRAVVLCPTRELAEQVFQVAKSLCHHARFRAAMVGGGSRMKTQEDSLNKAIDLIVATPGRLLMHIEQGNMAYGDLKYVVLDEADTMFDKGFAVEVKKFLNPLRNRSRQPEGEPFQTVLVTATVTKAVQSLLDEEFPGIRHIHTSTLHKKVTNARHDFVRLTGAENKLEALIQVLEPNLAKGRRVMVFCNTLGSCRAVDHFLSERGTTSVNYHGAVPADERVENLQKFKDADEDSVPALVCTDLAARGLDLVCDHVINFDFPLNPIDYLHRTGRTARMGRKGMVTSLVTKRDQTLAVQLEEAMRRGDSLEALTNSREKLASIKKKEVEEKRKAKAQKLGISLKYSNTQGSRSKTQRGTRGEARVNNTSGSSSRSSSGSSRSGSGSSRAGSNSSSGSSRSGSVAMKRR
jgi:superfamily II DNA/RNA helicase